MILNFNKRIRVGSDFHIGDSKVGVLDATPAQNGYGPGGEEGRIHHLVIVAVIRIPHLIITMHAMRFLLFGAPNQPKRTHLLLVLAPQTDRQSCENLQRHGTPSPSRSGCEIPMDASRNRWWFSLISGFRDINRRGPNVHQSVNPRSVVWGFIL
jgi:hypothetical protein